MGPSIFFPIPMACRKLDIPKQDENRLYIQIRAERVKVFCFLARDFLFSWGPARFQTLKSEPAL